MKKSKTPLELHHVHSETGSYDLAYLVLFAMAHVLLLTCVMMTVAEYADSIAVLSIFKMLIIGHILIGLIILSPLAYTFSKHDHSKTIVGMRIKGHKSELSKSSNKVWTLIQCVALYISGIAFIHFISVLFGAPLVRDIDKTCHFAMLLSSAAVLPGIILFGCCQEEWVRVFILGKTNNVLEYVICVTTVTSVVGAWLGAFPIPLDWDRPWQVWPISCVIGTVIGFDTGLLGGIAFLQYTRLRYGKKAT